MTQTGKHHDELSESQDDNDKMDIDSGDESDGKSALRLVEARDQPRAAWRGPSNASIQHFHEPTPIIDRSGQKHWEFQCRFCPWYVQFSIINR